MVGLSIGIKYLEITTDPVELWAAPHSRARIEKDHFDKTFEPFYRTEQIFIRPTNQTMVKTSLIIYFISLSQLNYVIKM